MKQNKQKRKLLELIRTEINRDERVHITKCRVISPPRVQRVHGNVQFVQCGKV